MGSGFKDFAAGDILTAADVDGYLMRQTVMTFADAAARDSALSGVLDEGMTAYLEDVNQTTYYTGSAWATLVGSWQNYTPTYTGLTIVNGTVVARWMECNGMVSFYFRWTVGSSDSVPGPYTVSLPVAPAYYGHIFNGYVRIPATTTVVVAAENFADQTDNNVRLRNANSGAVGNATVSSGNIVVIEGTYEKA